MKPSDFGPETEFKHVVPAEVPPAAVKQDEFSLDHVLVVKEWMLKTHTWAPRTLLSRKSSVKSWFEWTERSSVDEVPSVEGISNYLVHEVMRGRRISGISTYLGGIGLHFIDSGALKQEQWTQIITSREVRLLKRAAANRERVLGLKTMKASAMQIEEVELLCKSAQTYDDVVKAAATVTGFFNLHRGGEIVSPNPGEEILKLPFAQRVRVDADGVQYTIQSTKTAVYVETDLRLDRHDVPEWALEIWTRFWKQRSDRGLGDFPDIFILSDMKVLSSSQLNTYLSKTRKLSTHSLRAGGATHMMMSGKTLLQVMRRGRWSTIRSLLGYLRENPLLGNLFKEIKTFNGNLIEPGLADF